MEASWMGPLMPGVCQPLPCYSQEGFGWGPSPTPFLKLFLLVHFNNFVEHFKYFKIHFYIKASIWYKI